MSGINDVLKGSGCVLKKWVCRSQHPLCFVCVCFFYFLILFYLCCRIAGVNALPRCSYALKHKEVEVEMM